MFDLSWVELMFCAALALIIVGPRDMPKLLKMFSNTLRKIKKFYFDMQAGINKLEKEVDITSAGGGTRDNWQNYLPEDLQRLPDNYLPGQMSADEYARARDNYRNEVARAKQRFQEATGDGDNNGPASPDTNRPATQSE